MDSSILFSLVLPVLIALAVASRGFRVDQEYGARWASSAGLELTEETRPVVLRNLTWSRRSRTMGGLVGFLTPVIYAQVAEAALGREVITESDAAGWSVVLMFIGYLLGALFAELMINRPGQHHGPALPGSRQLGDYLSHYLLVIQRSLGITCAALVGAYVLVATLVPTSGLDPGSIAIFGLPGVGLAVVIEAIQRIIIGRRQPATSPDDLAVDDAMRSSSVHLVAGTGIALLIVFASGLITALLTLVETRAGVAGFALMLLLFPLSIAFWLDSGKPHGFRVRRDRNGRVAA